MSNNTIEENKKIDLGKNFSFHEGREKKEKIRSLQTSFRTWYAGNKNIRTYEGR